MEWYSLLIAQTDCAEVPYEQFACQAVRRDLISASLCLPQIKSNKSGCSISRQLPYHFSFISPER